MSSSSSTIRTRKFMGVRSYGMLLARRRPCANELRSVCAPVCTAIWSSVAAQSPTVGKYSSLPDVTSMRDIGKGHCNNGWVIFEDYVLVIDANFPSGAREVIPRIRELTKKPIRFAFDTHHHGDHAYGNQVVDEGATAVAHTGVLDEMKRLETGQFGGQPGRWEARQGARGCAQLEAEAADAAVSRHADLRRREASRRAAPLRHGAHEGGQGSRGCRKIGSSSPAMQ